ncbi:MAG: hypothetical protein DHS20C08_19350 [Rhodomicrobium sp.]|nr:MAG: hypothetical protein DHS20C08_19350 [Rhodomicrobium sp.]
MQNDFFQSLQLSDYITMMMGIYLLAAGIGLVIDRAGAKTMISDFYNQPALSYISGIIAFVFGAVLLRLHHDWSSFQNGLVSLIGWGALIEGVLLLAVRRQYLGLFLRLGQSDVMLSLVALFCFAVGVLLLWSALY